MSNTYFRFKQFTIQQDRCAMKVSTDACIHGAWTPVVGDVKHILDIGTGTGLLSLMLAQRAPATIIDALELNVAAAQQAAENAAAFPFAKQIQVHHTDALEWTAPYKYDLIICNPPFFQKALKGPDKARNEARHSQALDMPALVTLCLQHLSETGTASFLWPKPEHETFADMASSSGLHLIKQLAIRHRTASAVSRVVGIYTRNPSTPTVEELIIKNDQDEYTQDFTKLLSPFYLHL